MEPLTMGLIGVGAGLGKSLLFDGPREARQRKQRAAEIRYNPWTKMEPSTQIQESDAFGSALQGGMTGFSLGQNMQNQDLMKSLADRGYAKAVVSPMDTSVPNYPAIPTASQSPQTSWWKI